MILFKIFKSPNRAVYFKIAKKYNTSIWRVYRLAHGKKVYLSGKTLDILKELKELGIIDSVRF